MRFTVLSLLLSTLLFVVMGCRSYGGYGAEEALYEEIVRLVQQFEQDLSRSSGELAAIQEAATQTPELATLSEDFSLMLAGHEALLDEQQEAIRELSPNSGYRTLHSVHGAILAVQRTVRNQRMSLLAGAGDRVADDTSAFQDTSGVQDVERPYALIPPYYDRIAPSKQVSSVNELLRQIGTTPAPVDTSQGEENGGAEPGNTDQAGEQPDGAS